MMFRRGLALCLVLGFTSFAKAQTATISFAPNGGNFAPNQVVNVDVLVTQSNGANKSLRYAQLDYTATTLALRNLLTLPTTHSGAVPTVQAFDFTGLGNCGAANSPTCGAGHYIEDTQPAGLRPNIIAIAYKELSTSDLTKPPIILANGVPKKIATLQLTMPAVPGPYTLDVVNTSDANNTDKAGEIRWGFGVTGDAELIRLRAGSNLLGGTAVFNVSSQIVFVSALPAATAGTGPNVNTIRVLSRTTKNEARLEFSGNLPAPAAGIVMIREMTAGGGFGPDLAGSFTPTLGDSAAPGADTARLILKDNGSNLVHKKWYQVESTGTWAGVGPFCLQFLVQAGDCNGDGNVNAADLTCVNSSVPTLVIPAAADGLFRKDINAAAGIGAADITAANGKIPSLLVQAPKPTGHTTCP